MEILVGLLIVLGIITVIGHAIWWTLATIFRAMFGESPKPMKTVSMVSECVECGASLQLKDDFCSACGRPQKKTAANADPLSDLAMTTRQIDRFLNLGKIDLATYQQVMKAIEEERERLTQPMRPQQPVKHVVENLQRQPGPNINPELIVADKTIISKIATPPSEAQEPETIFDPVFASSPTANREAVVASKPEPVYARPEPRRSFAEMLETFMEESSIRWGELIGGVLIIGCSLALVISLWSQITAVPLLKFSVFVGVTAGLFGIGFYSAHRWKLPTTSRGALTISILLVPLNFLAMTAFSQSADPNSAIIVGGEFAALVLFVFLVYQAAKVIAPDNSWLMTAATLLPSFSMLIAKHWQNSQAAMVWLVIAPLISYWLATGMMLRGSKEADRERLTNQIFLILGIASFASLLPFGLLLAKSGIFSITVRSFSAFITLFGVPGIACGLTLRTESGLSGKTKTAATSVALLGALLAFGGLALAWPRPLPLIIVALINCAVCGVIAWRLEWKPAHATAIALFALAYLLGASVLFGGYPGWLEDDASLIASFWTRSSGLAWLTLFVIFGAAAEFGRRIGRKNESCIHDFAAVISAFFSLLILSWHGFGQAGDPHHVALVYAFYAFAAFVIAWHRNQFIACWIGLGLSLLTILQIFAFKFGYQLAPHHPVRLSFLTFASLATVTAIALRKGGEKSGRIFVQPMTAAALIGSIAVAPFVLIGGWMTLEQLTGRIFWLAAIWFALSIANAWRSLFTAFQALLTVGVICGVAAIFDARALPLQLSWSHPYRLQAQGIAVVLLSLVWIAARLKVRHPREIESASLFQRLLFTPWPFVDQIAIEMVWLLLVVLSLGSVDWAGASMPVVSDFAIRAKGFGSWLLMLALTIVFLVSLWEQFRKRLPLALMTLLTCACLLLAGRWTDSGSVETAFRWLAAISFALVALPIIFRHRLHRICERFNWPRMKEVSSGLSSLARAESVALFAVPVLALTAGTFLARPAEATLLSAKLVFLAPLFLIALTLAAHAIRERSAIYAFACGLILNLSVTIGYSFDGNLRLITALQANVLTSATVSLIWLVIRGWITKGNEDKRAVNGLLQWQIHATLLANLTLLGYADAQIVVSPAYANETVVAFGSVLGWLATSLSVTAWLGLRKVRFGNWVEKLSFDHIGVALLVATSLIVCSLSRFADGWASYHAFMVGIAASAWVMFAGRNLNCLKLGDVSKAIGWATGLGAVQLLLTLRGIEAPNSFWWTVSSFATLSLLFGWMAVAWRNRVYVYLSAPFLNVIASMLFARHWNMWEELPEFLAVNVIVLSLTSLIWLWLDWKLMRSKMGRYPFHRQTIKITLPTVFLLSSFHWFIWLVETDHPLLIWLNWAAILSVAALLIAYLWENNVLASLRGLYLLGWIMVLEGCCLVSLSETGLLAFTATTFSLYALGSGWLWRKREGLNRLAERIGLDSPVGTAELIRSWILAWNSLLAFGVVLTGFAIVFLSSSLTARLMVTTGAFALPVAFAWLARKGQDQGLITAGIRLCLLNVVMWSWAWLSPVRMVGWQSINRLVIVILIVEGILIAYRLVFMRRIADESLWRKQLRADLPGLAGIGLISLAIVLVVEFSQLTKFGAVLIGWPAIVAILLTLLGVSLIGIAFAVLPGEDPFDLDERGRMRYVYASEGFLVLTFVHLRMTMPWMFGGAFSAYWPILVMMLAFAGVGLAEFFQRQGKLVLAEPLGKTGIILPLLPVIGLWSLDSEVPYSGLLLLVGLFYGVLSIMRRSFTFGILAAVAGNAGLWHFLNGVGGLRFYEHPQLWLIPAALSVLLAARINRHSLSAEQMNSIRYATLIIIYVSSTADIFLNGVTDSPWLPIILAALAVGGVAAGLMLRIRAFLFLGTAFLLLSMLTMIWSASVNLQWTWLWYVTGIGFGILIIYTVAMFERKREQMLGFLERLKQWQ